MTTHYFKHDCDCCRPLGAFTSTENVRYDLYACGDSVIARFGDMGPDYVSAPVQVLPQYPEGHVLKEAESRLPAK